MNIAKNEESYCLLTQGTQAPLGVYLKSGFGLSHLLVIPLTTTVITYAGTFFNVAVIILLRDPAFFGVQEGEIGRVTNDIIFYSQLMQILFTLAAGYLYDILGRRLTIIFTMLPGAIVVMFIPNVAPSILLLIIIRICSSFGIWTLGCHPFINDYITKETRGRAVAIQSAGFIVGDLFTFVVMLNLTRAMTPYGRF
jgi:MFS family permease